MNTDMIIARWKSLNDNKTMNSMDIMQWIVLRAMNNPKLDTTEKKLDFIHARLQKAFTPITNANKLANGKTAYNTIEVKKYLFNKIVKWYKNDPRKITLLQDPIGGYMTAEEQEEFLSLWNSINVSKLGRQYVYYFTRTDMSPEQIGVQAGHALFVLGNKIKDKGFDPSKVYFQWIGVENEKALNEIAVNHKNRPFVSFREPDMENSLTTLAFYPILWNRRDEFKEYPLLTH